MVTMTANVPASEQGAAVEVRQLSKAFGSLTVVDNVSFHIHKGTFLTLLGPSGSGKTTILRMIAGFEAPTTGDILVAGETITDMPAHKRNIGMVFQNYALFPHMTVFQNVAYPLEMRRFPAAEISRRVNSALGLVKLAGFEQRYPTQLSGGQQQRVGLARAIVFEPPVMLMDESLGALDKRLRETMQIEIKHLQKRLGITTISVTHDQVEAIVMSDLIAVLDGGVLQQIGKPLEVYHNPANKFVADFIGESNLLNGTLDKKTNGSANFRTAKGLSVSVISRPDESSPAYLLVRPEYVRIGSAADNADNKCCAEIREILYLGDLVKCRLALESGDELICKNLISLVRQDLAVGLKLRVGWDRQDCLLLRERYESK